MDTQNIKLISQLDLLTDEYTMKLRILRLWRQPMNTDPTKTYSIELIFMDEQGNRIQGNVFNQKIKKFEKFLEEGADLYIYRPTLCQHPSKFKYVKHDYKLGLVWETTVKKCLDFTGSTYGFAFAKYEAILNNVYAEYEAFDVIGDVFKCYEMSNVSKDKEKPLWRMSMLLQDLEGTKLNFTLWGNFALQMSDYIKSHNGNSRLIVALQFGKLKLYEGRQYVSNSFDVSKLFINSDIPEINEFRKNLLQSPSEAISNSQMSMYPSIRDEFVLQTDFKPICDIMDVSEIKKVMIVATIKGIPKTSPWFYWGCPDCSRKPRKEAKCVDKPDGSGEVVEIVTFFCDNDKCNTYTCQPVPTFRITLRVQDITGLATLTLFDNHAKKLLHTTAADLYEQYREADESDNIPNEFQVLIDQKYAFKIDINVYNLQNNCTTYGISKLTQDEEVITALEKKLLGEQVTQSDSVNVAYSDFCSQDKKMIKDSVSCTGDNSTPLSHALKSTASSPLAKEKNNTKSLATPSSCLKRNLHDVYDVEDIVEMSATKSSKDVALDSKKKQLITPKIEK